MITMAIGIANGLPLSAVATTQEIAATTAGAGLTISTFGGNPVSTAAAIGTLEQIKSIYTPVHSAQMGALLREGLEELQAKYSIIGDVRGRGLMQGIELVSDRSTKEPAPKHTNALLETTRQVGLLIGKGGLYGNSLRIAPPLITKAEHIEEALEKLDYAFGQVMELSF